MNKALDWKDTSIVRSISASINNKSEVSAIIVDGESYKSTFTEEYTTAQTATSIITPTSGHKLCIRNVHIQTDGTSGEVQLDFLTSGKKIARLYVTKQNRDWYSLGCLSGAIDEPLSLTTTTGASKVFILINYIETQ